MVVVNEYVNCVLCFVVILDGSVIGTYDGDVLVVCMRVKMVN